MEDDTKYPGMPKGLAKINKVLGKAIQSMDDGLRRFVDKEFESECRFYVNDFVKSLVINEIDPYHDEHYPKIQDRFIEKVKRRLTITKTSDRLTPQDLAGKQRQETFFLIDELVKNAGKFAEKKPGRSGIIRQTARLVFLRGAKVAESTDGGHYDWKGINDFAMPIVIGNISQVDFIKRLNNFRDNPNQIVNEYEVEDKIS